MSKSIDMRLCCSAIPKTLLTYETGEFEDGTPFEVYVELCGKNIRAYDNDPRSPHIESARINYCPICGRKL